MRVVHCGAPLFDVFLIEMVFSPRREHTFRKAGALMQAIIQFSSMVLASTRTPILTKAVLSCRREHHFII